MINHGPKSQAFFDRAQKVIPNGVSSNYRYYGNEETPVVAKAQGAFLYDFDGRRFIDYRLGWGPVILGHADPLVNQRVKDAIDQGVSFAATQQYEVSVAERIIDLCPGVEMVRLANTGSECTMHAIRLARGFTGRDLLLKFEGSYHGAHDSVLWSTQAGDLAEMGSRQDPIAYKQSTGIPDLLQELTLICAWNDSELLGELLLKRGHEIAAIIVEPILGNANALMPLPGFLEFLRAQCDEYGIVLIFDEVKVGFRIAPGGAREYFGVIPDLSAYAKAMGNGFPIAALAGRREIMLTFGSGQVFHGGTYTGNVVSTAAADATLEQIQRRDLFTHINQIGTALQDGIRAILNQHGIPHCISGTPGMFGVCLSEKQPRGWRELMRFGDWALSGKIHAYLLAHGIMPEPGGVEPFFICAAHTQAHVDETLQRYEEAVSHAKGAI